MTVKEMIKHLEKCNPDHVLLVDYEGYYEAVICDVIKPEKYDYYPSAVCIAKVKTEF